MNISKDTNEIIQFLDYTSGNNLRKRNDLGVLLEFAGTYGNADEINDLIFHAASLWNLHKTIKRNQRADENIEKIKSEVYKTAQIVRIKLLSIIGEENNEISKRFRSVYLNEDKGSLLNLIDLARDISELKHVVNELKSKNT